MSQTVKKLNQRFATISPREKGLVLIAGIVVLVMVGYWWFIEPQMQALATEQQKLASTEKQINSLSLQIQEVENALSVDPNVALKKKWLALENEQHQLDLQYNQQTQDLIPARQMPNVLERLLIDSHSLKLISMTSIAPTVLIDGAQDDMQSGMRIYQHGVQLVLEGQYFDIQQYLQQVQQLQWRFFWRQFNYQVQEFPIARVELSLYTLSNSQAFIGM